MSGFKALVAARRSAAEPSFIERPRSACAAEVPAKPKAKKTQKKIDSSGKPYNHVSSETFSAKRFAQDAQRHISIRP